MNNLISLGKIYGCKYTEENGIIKISRGTLTVIKARRSRSLYILQGKTVTGTVAISTSSMLEEDTIKLWHLILGHMSEKGMIVFSKMGLLCG